MKDFKKILIFFTLFFSLVGAIGSLGYLIYYHQYFMAAFNLIVAGMAAPVWLFLLEILLGKVGIKK